jgi:hypothetical protein
MVHITGTPLSVVGTKMYESTGYGFYQVQDFLVLNTGLSAQAKATSTPVLLSRSYKEKHHIAGAGAITQSALAHTLMLNMDKY